MLSEIGRPETGVGVTGGQSLLDCRLDLLDKMLVGVLPRGRRLEFVRGIELRILQQLSALTTGEPTEEQMLAALSQCEPLETVLATALSTARSPAIPQAEAAAALNLLVTPRPQLKIARIAGFLGVASLLLLLAAPYFYLAAMLSADYFGEVWAYLLLGTILVLLLGAGMAASGTGLVALWKLRRRRGTHTGYTYATGGLIAGCIPMAFAGVLGVIAISELLSEMNTTSAVAATPPPAPLAGNGAGATASVPVASAIDLTAGERPAATRASYPVIEAPLREDVSAAENAESLLPPEPAPARLGGADDAVESRQRQLIDTSDNFRQVNDEWQRIWWSARPDPGQTVENPAERARSGGALPIVIDPAVTRIGSGFAAP